MCSIFVVSNDLLNVSSESIHSAINELRTFVWRLILLVELVPHLQERLLINWCFTLKLGFEVLVHVCGDGGKKANNSFKHSVYYIKL